ncbi:MAG: sarcosine oxidase subunit delta [Rhodobacteraceae bacterium]|nr:sarcosine oxidase subunit delta [Paracoccaceae bacterium]
MVITCPFCGPRDEREFEYCGPAAPPRPEDASVVSDRGWVEYLTSPPNPVGPVEEIWWHKRGCEAWIRLCRDTVTHEILPTREVRK